MPQAASQVPESSHHRRAIMLAAHQTDDDLKSPVSTTILDTPEIGKDVPDDERLSDAVPGDGALHEALSSLVVTLRDCRPAGQWAIYLNGRDDPTLRRIASTAVQSFPDSLGDPAAFSGENLAENCEKTVHNHSAVEAVNAVDVKCIHDTGGLSCVLIAVGGGMTPVDAAVLSLGVEQARLLLRNHQLFATVVESRQTRLQLAQQQDALHQVIHAVLESATVAECYSQITSLAPSALGAHFCTILLTTARPGFFEVVATTNPAILHYLHTVRDFRGMHPESAAEGRCPVVSNELSEDPKAPSEVRASGKGMASIVAPLISKNGEPFGVIAIVRRGLGPVDEDFIRLCDGFAHQAARAIETTRLHQAARRGAETRELLLRELNHRVKNSLAGIVGLLTNGRPKMEGDQKEWLDRVVQRITVMARGHKLFDGYQSAVPIRSLIDSAVEAAEPHRSGASSVAVSVDASADAVMLQSEQGVALAMVLHELCCNALTYSPQHASVVGIHAFRQDASQRCVDITNPVMPGLSSVPRSWNSTRLGLQLVQALVARELGGKFSTYVRDDGVNIATVSFKHVLSAGD